MTAPDTHRGPPYDLILLDCDSTLCRMEGIDELAARAGIVEQLRPITDAAMAGTTSFDVAYADRLALLRPDRKAIDWLAQRYHQTLLEDAAELIAALQDCGKAVHIVSGGIRQALAGLAEPLGLPADHILAVDLSLDTHGAYAGYDQDSPLCHQHGKAAVGRLLARPGERTVMVGDGITDLEVIAAGIDFVGFGGVARRPAVEARAAAYHPGPDLTGLLPLLLTASELRAVRK